MSEESKKKPDWKLAVVGIGVTGLAALATRESNRNAAHATSDEERFNYLSSAQHYEMLSTAGYLLTLYEIYRWNRTAAIVSSLGLLAFSGLGDRILPKLVRDGRNMVVGAISARPADDKRPTDTRTIKRDFPNANEHVGWHSPHDSDGYPYPYPYSEGPW